MPAYFEMIYIALGYHHYDVVGTMTTTYNGGQYDPDTGCVIHQTVTHVLEVESVWVWTQINDEDWESHEVERAEAHRIVEAHRAELTAEAVEHDRADAEAWMEQMHW